MVTSLGLGLGLTQQRIIAILGPELVVDGDFSSAVNWTFDANWSIGGGVATADGGAGENIQTVTGFSSGKSYRAQCIMDFTGDFSLANTTFQIRNAPNTSTIVQINQTAMIANEVNVLSMDFVANAASFVVRSFTGDAFTWDDVSIREIL